MLVKGYKHVIAIQAQKALAIYNKYRCNYKTSASMSFDIFDWMIVPILLYGSEIWDHTVRYEIEKVNLKFCKKILCLRTSATDGAVLREVRRFPL